ncbi:MAG: hypothetical protein KatS3mg081_1595 [Gemmatimonadales bacterium]|nr:MAG: hypothetical protein KatS3mg081_1595 [Gemmatimonadales bacterium]
MTCPTCGKEAVGKFCSNCGAALSGATCRVCSAPLSPGARFCHLCGSAVAAPPSAAAGSKAQWLPWTVAAAAAAALVGVLLGRSGESSASGAAAGGFAASGGAPMATTDISSMTPRERADRLFDRIMRAAARGDTGEIEFFTPMALQAYALLDQLDADARYHIGLIQAEAGNLDATLAQADSIERTWPGHLFGGMLRAEVARRRGQSSELRRWYRWFLERYEREQASGKPEYSDHRTALEAFRNDALANTGGTER